MSSLQIHRNGGGKKKKATEQQAVRIQCSLKTSSIKKKKKEKIIVQNTLASIIPSSRQEGKLETSPIFSETHRVNRYREALMCGRPQINLVTALSWQNTAVEGSSHCLHSTGKQALVHAVTEVLLGGRSFEQFSREITSQHCCSPRSEHKTSSNFSVLKYQCSCTLLVVFVCHALCGELANTQEHREELSGQIISLSLRYLQILIM